MQLPKSVIDELFARHSIDEWPAVVSEAIRRVLSGSASDRMRMMQRGLPSMQGPLMTASNLYVDEGLEQEFNRFCESKMLRSEVLLAGSVLDVLGAGGTGDAGGVPDCPAVPRSVSITEPPRSGKP